MEIKGKVPIYMGNFDWKTQIYVYHAVISQLEAELSAQARCMALFTNTMMQCFMTVESIMQCIL